MGGTFGPLLLIGGMLLLVVVGAGTARGAILYAAGYQNDKLYKIDTQFGTVDEVGEFEYFCEIHPRVAAMRNATIIVEP